MARMSCFKLQSCFMLHASCEQPPAGPPGGGRHGDLEEWPLAAAAALLAPALAPFLLGWHQLSRRSTLPMTLPTLLDFAPAIADRP